MKLIFEDYEDDYNFERIEEASEPMFWIPELGQVTSLSETKSYYEEHKAEIDSDYEISTLEEYIDILTSMGGDMYSIDAYYKVGDKQFDDLDWAIDEAEEKGLSVIKVNCPPYNCGE